eukprot:990657-Rhodomonas_salina.1
MDSDSRFQNRTVHSLPQSTSASLKFASTSSVGQYGASRMARVGSYMPNSNTRNRIRGTKRTEISVSCV